MVYLFSIFLLMSSAFANPDMECEQAFPDSTFNTLSDINSIMNHKALQLATPYYFYLETTELEDLQAFKNCIDYSQCGKYQESIVDDPKNFRMHIWKSMTSEQLTELVKSCPVKDIEKKLVVRSNGQMGQVVNMKSFIPDRVKQNALSYAASPAIYNEPTLSESKAMVEVIRSNLNMNKVANAEQLILKTWNINLHGYSLTYTGEKGSYAVTTHAEKTIKYGKDWLSEPCDYIRMIRHEAEHVAQVKMASSCYGNHNFSDHNKRERAAHLNDARFMKNVCGTLKDGETVRQFCLKRFRTNYMNNKK